LLLPRALFERYGRIGHGRYENLVWHWESH